MNTDSKPTAKSLRFALIAIALSCSQVFGQGAAPEMDKARPNAEKTPKSEQS